MQSSHGQHPKLMIVLGILVALAGCRSNPYLVPADRDPGTGMLPGQGGYQQAPVESRYPTDQHGRYPQEPQQQYPQQGYPDDRYNQAPPSQEYPQSRGDTNGGYTVEQNANSQQPYDQYDRRASVSQVERDRYAYVSRPESTTSSNSAVRKLINTAKRQRAEGDLGGAAATLERALRVSPQDPNVYYELASVRLMQHNYRQAEQLARRGLTLTRDAGMKARFRDLIRESQTIATQG
ncbi:tetratricopeptide repeat protein [Zooshikella sp. RANM57]|uniref:tetratricopeptide repeat protein n=1 Tax=Zooshikella sp. RANM57 TaxID=3425863 RepID=UPI003D6EFA7D